MTAVAQEPSKEPPPPATEAQTLSTPDAGPEAAEANASANPFDDGETHTPAAVAATPTAAPNDASVAQEVREQHDAPASVSQENAPEVPPRIPPEVEGLYAMFPDFDVAILQSVLQSVDGNQERAADILLGMSDPEYNSQSHNAQPQPQQRELSQEELDEQFARRLAFEEQQQSQVQQQQASWHPDELYPGHQYRGQSFGQRRDVPYEPRHSGQHPQGQQGQWSGQQQGGGRDTMTEVQEQLSKFAETGKKTFSSLVSKVKAKMQEFDQNRNSGSTGPPPQSSWGSGTPASQGSQYYAPTAGRGDYSRPMGYDAAPQPQHATLINTSTVPGVPLATSTSASSTPVSEIAISASPPPPVTAPRPPSTGPPPASVDPTKVGMLPKRPVSLLGSNPAQSTAARKPADDDELDYVENPFEDERH